MQDTGMRSELNSDVSGGNERDSALESAVDIKIDRIWWSNKGLDEMGEEW